MKHRRVALVALGLFAGLVLPACAGGGMPESDQPRVVNGGNAERGERAILQYGCASCHSIPGIPSVDDDSIAPNLHDFSDRYYIAGQVPNRPEELIQWLQNPQEIEPGTLMPNMGVTEQDARDIAAYLYGR